MGDSSHEASTFWTQADALLRKNLTYQKRNVTANLRLVLFPLVLCLLLVLLQSVLDSSLNKSDKKCGCQCIDINGDGSCDRVCGLEFSDTDQARRCPIPSPPAWPPLLQIPAPEYRAVRSSADPSADMPDESCRRTGSCSVTVFITGSNQTLGEILGGNMFTSSGTPNPSNLTDIITNIALGSSTKPQEDNFLDPAFDENVPLYYLQRQCLSNSAFNVSVPDPDSQTRTPHVFQKAAICAQTRTLWRNGSSAINDEIYKGYYKGNPERKINEILAAYDFLNSDRSNFNVSIWYNATYKDTDSGGNFNLMRLPRFVNLVSNAFLQLVQGSGSKIIFEFIKEMPKFKNEQKLEISSLLGTLFFTWVILQLFPVVLTSLVYEKQQKLRIMMKMHGLGDGPYWLISYAYFLTISALYMLVFVLFGSVVGLKFFTMNDYMIQLVFYFFYINLQVSLAFLASIFFTSVKTATVVGYIFVFGTGLLGGFLFQSFVEDTKFPNAGIILMELYPGFALYRGMYEFAQYSFTGISMGTDGMRWGDLSDSGNGMNGVIIIIVVEWLVVLFVAYYLDIVLATGSGKSPLFFLEKFRKKPPSSFRKPSFRMQESRVFVDMDKPDVMQEREKVEQILLEPSSTHAIVSDNIKKVYPGRDGNPEKVAVKGLSLVVPRGECFGMLGPNGAGKTSFISMMIGLTKPSSGTAFIEGLDIRNDMDWIYTSMGVCPQHDLLWETLTGREHLLFYGRLKNLKGAALKQAVEESLKSVNLFNGGVADKQSGKYSGGMKRRLSVAISLIGDPKVVYMDEPSTGLDPASRSNLWNVVKRAKEGRAIILTTHSMEEAEHLCDRLGIFVSGSLQCIGNAKELKARYGGSYVFTMTTSMNDEQEVVNLVRRLSPNAERTYHMAGTQKFEMPKHEVRIADVFHAVEVAKSRFTVYAWGLSDTTLEDVFIKVATSAEKFHVLT